MALSFIEKRFFPPKRIPDILFGILFFFSPVPSKASDTRLAEELFLEGNYAVCVRESLRVLTQTSRDETAVLLNASASLRAGMAGSTEHLSALIKLAREANAPGIRGQAANEAAWHLFKQGKISDAGKLAEQAFLTASNSLISLSSGALLTRITTQHPGTFTPSSSLSLQLQSCAHILAEIPPPPFAADSASDRHSLLSLPGQWIVSFYRHAIRPAIGTRCSLSPSCSEYFLQASHKHKLLAIPMVADRLVREPSVVNSGGAVSRKNGKTIILDPLDNHDFWMTANP